jgi:SAM-dependent methyltransferase
VEGRSARQGREPTAEWAKHAEEWLCWARVPGHDSYWRFHRDAFLPMVPTAPGRVLDLGCGEGRLSRDLRKAGYHVTGVDASRVLVEAARDADGGDVVRCDAAHLPFREGGFDVVVAFMSLQDVDDLEAAIAEAVRVLPAGGHLCLAVVHPVNSAGTFESEDPGSRFIIEDSYMATWDYTNTIERDGIEMTFTSVHRPLGDYFALLARHRLVVDELREVIEDPASVTEAPRRGRWTRLPLFLHLRALRQPAPASDR